jgi:hypothetical protein
LRSGPITCQLCISWPATEWPDGGLHRLKARGATFPNDDLNLNIAYYLGHGGYILVATTVLWYCPELTMHELHTVTGGGRSDPSDGVHTGCPGLTIHELHTGGDRSDPSDGVHTGTLKLLAGPSQAAPAVPRKPQAH